MDQALRTAIEAIHSSPTHAVFNLAGGASQALGWLLAVPRASQTVLEATVPYARASMVQILGKVPQQFTSSDIADDLALAAYNRALALSSPGTSVAGVGFTGALASAIPKRGDHRCYLSARTHAALWRYDLTFLKGYRDRIEEDRVSSQLLIKALADVSMAGVHVPLDLKQPEEQVHQSKLDFTEEQELEQLLNGQLCMIRYAGQDSIGIESGRRVILSGAFNPLHEGHLKLMSTACSFVENGIPCFELAAVNADKPALTVDQIKQRVKQFSENGKTIVVTNQPFFYKKAEILPDSTFLVGVDTAVRLVSEKYYGGSRHRMLEVLTNVRSLGCDFIVAGRKVGENFKTMADVDVPPEVETMFRALPEDVFRVDLSSTEIRQKFQTT